MGVIALSPSPCGLRSPNVVADLASASGGYRVGDIHQQCRGRALLAGAGVDGRSVDRADPDAPRIGRSFR